MKTVKTVTHQQQVSNISGETLFNYITEKDKSNIYLRLEGLNGHTLKFEAIFTYPFDGKYKGLSSVKSNCYEYKVTALVPLTEWANVCNKDSLTEFVNYVWPRNVHEYIQFTFVRTY